MRSTLFVGNGAAPLRPPARPAWRVAPGQDPLTGLPGRRRFLRKVGSLERAGSDRAVVVVDLDGFRTLNAVHGCAAGDLVLRIVANRIRGAAGHRPCGRVGADEFAVLVAGGREAAEALAQRLLDAVGEPFSVDLPGIGLRARVGIACCPPESTSVDLLRRAERAVEIARRLGRRVAIDPDGDEADDDLRLLVDLHGAVAGDSLDVAFQPVLDLRTGTVVAVEALARWQHPDLGAVSPARFVPLAERSDLVLDLTDRILQQAVQAQAALAASGHRIDIAVNVSARYLDDRLVSIVRRHLPRFVGRLTLEVTETGLMIEPDVAERVLHELHDLGVGVAIDDFGVGRSSLAYLADLPVTTLKIDRSLVRRLTGGGAAAAVVSTAIDLGRRLGLQVVAEGVEADDEQLQLDDLGCDRVQGFHIAPPLPLAELLAFLAAR